MNYDNPSFFEQHQDVITDELFIGSTPEDLQREIRNNLWRISVSQDQIDQLTIHDWKIFIEKVIENRIHQIRAANKHSMIFYVWFDQPASQLHFCLISSFHEKLPFGGAIEIINDPTVIYEEFLTSPYHDGIPLTELDIVNIDEFVEADIPTKPTLVYKTVLS